MIWSTNGFFAWPSETNAFTDAAIEAEKLALETGTVHVQKNKSKIVQKLQTKTKFIYLKLQVLKYYSLTIAQGKNFILVFCFL